MTLLFTIYCNGQRADLLSLDEIARRDVHDGGCQDAGGALPTRLLAACIAGCLLAVLALTAQAHADELPLAVQIVACESAGRENLWGDDRKSFGIAQFQRVTFETFKRRSGMTEARWDNGYDQLMMLRWALAHNHGRHWTCWRKIERGTWRMTRALEVRMTRNLLLNEVQWRM